MSKEIRHRELLAKLDEIIQLLRQAQRVGTLQYNQVDPMQPHQVMRALEAQQTQSESPLNLQRQYRPSSPYQQESPVTEHWQSPEPPL